MKSLLLEFSLYQLPLGGCLEDAPHLQEGVIIIPDDMFIIYGTDQTADML